jgi:RNA polymerase-binding protein DksA
MKVTGTGNKAVLPEVAASAPRRTAPKLPAASKSAALKKASPVAKKTMAPVIDVTQLRVKEGEEPWTQAELDEVLVELEEQREHSLAVLAVQEAELTGLMRDSGDGAGQDQADVGSTSFERDQELTVVNSEREKLQQIERALASIEEGTYGVCESCGEPIGKMRLLVFPRATLCVTCKQREERR